MKIAIKYLRLPPIYITSKQDNNLLLADRKPNGAYGRKAEYHNLITNHVAWKLQYIQGGNNYGNGSTAQYYSYEFQQTVGHHNKWTV